MKSILGRLHNNFVFERRVRVLAEQLANMIPRGAKVLDVGCGDGQISAQIAQKAATVSVVGVDILLRPKTQITVTAFDGSTLPFADGSFDVVMFVDVLHHTLDARVLLKEASRVTGKYILIKDHFRDGFLADSTLRLMDWFGNSPHGVVLPYNYLSRQEWDKLFGELKLREAECESRPPLYPIPLSLIFGRELHFIALLQKEE